FLFLSWWGRSRHAQPRELRHVALLICASSHSHCSFEAPYNSSFYPQILSRSSHAQPREL
ncbi:unnamed protein product, partial [Closterium sp. NIES-53]